jgi:predicted RecA/RadA family phage recombinase
MTNKNGYGDILDLTLSGGATSGDVVVVGKITGVAVKTISAGGVAPVDTEGIFTVACTVSAGGSIAIGDLLYCSATGAGVTNTGTTQPVFGKALAAATTASTTVKAVQNHKA